MYDSFFLHFFLFVQTFMKHQALSPQNLRWAWSVSSQVGLISSHLPQLLLVFGKSLKACSALANCTKDLCSCQTEKLWIQRCPFFISQRQNECVWKLLQVERFSVLQASHQRICSMCVPWWTTQRSERAGLSQHFKLKPHGDSVLQRNVKEKRLFQPPGQYHA